MRSACSKLQPYLNWTLVWSGYTSKRSLEGSWIYAGWWAIEHGQLLNLAFKPRCTAEARLKARVSGIHGISCTDFCTFSSPCISHILDSLAILNLSKIVSQKPSLFMQADILQRELALKNALRNSRRQVDDIAFVRQNMGSFKICDTISLASCVAASYIYSNCDVFRTLLVSNCGLTANSDFEKWPLFAFL